MLLLDLKKEKTHLVSRSKKDVLLLARKTHVSVMCIFFSLKGRDFTKLFSVVIFSVAWFTTEYSWTMQLFAVG